MTLQDLLDTYHATNDIDITLCTRGCVKLKKFKLSDYRSNKDKEIKDYLAMYVKEWWFTYNVIRGIIVRLDFEQYT